MEPTDAAEAAPDDAEDAAVAEVRAAPPATARTAPPPSVTTEATAERASAVADSEERLVSPALATPRREAGPGVAAEGSGASGRSAPHGRRADLAAALAVAGGDPDTVPAPGAAEASGRETGVSGAPGGSSPATGEESLPAPAAHAGSAHAPGAAQMVVQGDAARAAAALSLYGSAGEIADFHVPRAPIDLGPFGGEPHEQIVRAVRLQWSQGVGEAKLTLQPEHLGEVAISLRVEQGSVTALMRADSAAAAEWIRTHHQELQSSLDAQGLTLKALDVVVDTEDRRRRDPQDARGRQAPARRRSANEPRFEVHV
jgi:flagellar hook-length control protein FliK